MFAVHNPKNSHPITTLRAIVSRDKDGNEGIVGVEGVGPLVTASDRVLEFYKTIGKVAMASASDKEVFVVEFSNPKDLEKL